MPPRMSRSSSSFTVRSQNQSSARYSTGGGISTSGDHHFIGAVHAGTGSDAARAGVLPRTRTRSPGRSRLQASTSSSRSGHSGHDRIHLDDRLGLGQHQHRSNTRNRYPDDNVSDAYHGWATGTQASGSTDHRRPRVQANNNNHNHNNGESIRRFRNDSRRQANPDPVAVMQFGCPGRDHERDASRSIREFDAKFLAGSHEGHASHGHHHRHRYRL